MEKDEKGRIELDKVSKTERQREKPREQDRERKR